MLTAPRDRTGVDVLNKRIELLERALQAHSSVAHSPSTPGTSLNEAKAAGETQTESGRTSDSTRTAIDVDAVRGAEGKAYRSDHDILGTKDCRRTGTRTSTC